MVTSCSAIGCKERARKGNKTTFHRFPSRPQLREKWITATKRRNFVPTVNARICERHFKPDDFIILTNGRKTLKPDAIPEIFDFSEYVSKTDSYTAKKSPAVQPKLDNTSASIHCIQFVDVNSLASVLPLGSNRTVIVIDSNPKNSINAMPQHVSSHKNVDDTSSPQHENTYLQQLNNFLLQKNISNSIHSESSNNQPTKSIGNFSFPKSVPTSFINLNNFTSLKTVGETTSPNNLNAPSSSSNVNNPSVSKSSTSPIITVTKSVPPRADSTIQTYSKDSQMDTSGSEGHMRNRYIGDFTSAHLTNKWGRKQFLFKVKELKRKYNERLKRMIAVRRMMNKRKAFLENLLIRIKEKQLTSDDDVLDLMDCFVEEESSGSDEENSFSDDSSKALTKMVDEKILRMSDDLNRETESQDNACETFGIYVESLLNLMPEQNATNAKNRIKELINAYKGKKLIQNSKLGDCFPGLENIEIDD